MSNPEPTPQSAFLFVGQVLAQGAATMDTVPINRGTFVVGVTETMRSPAEIGDLSGFEITVQQETPSLELGETYVFAADGWLFGDSLAVVARSAEPFTLSAAHAARETATESPLEPIRERLSESELVVTGRVTRLNEVKRRPGEPITEHEPMWCEAVIDVDSVERSQSGSEPQRVTVRFAASQDAEWATAPKFSIGDAGLFLLGNVNRATEERAMSHARAEQYTLVRPEDALSLDHLDDVRAMVEEG
jgi:hypothetical protein